MTNAELIAKIKAEIERQQKENVNYDENGSFASYCDSTTWSVLDSILTFISDIENSEKPMNQDEELNEEIKRYIDEYYKEDSIVLIAHVARHFAQWGAEHLKK